MKQFILYLIWILYMLSGQPCKSKSYPSEWTSYQLTLRQEKNLVALAKMYGYVNYFYPNQSFATWSTVDKYKFLNVASQEVINANNDRILEEKLKDLFSPIDPELAFRKSEKLTSYQKNKPFYAWTHTGIGEHGFYYKIDDLFSSKIETFDEISNIVPVPDSLYLFPLTETVSLYIPLAISYQHGRESKEFKVLKKRIKKTKLKLFEINQVRAMYRFITGKKKPKDLVYLRSEHARIADIITKWNIVQHFYPYYEEDSLSYTWDSALIEGLHNATSCKNQFAYYDVVRHLMSYVKDSHIDVNTSIYVGGILGTYISDQYPQVKLDWANDTIYLAEVPDSLNFVLSTGDPLISINDIPIDTIVKQKWDLTSASTKQGKYEQLISRILLGYFSYSDSVMRFKFRNRHSVEAEVVSFRNRENLPFDLTNNRFIEKLDSGLYYVNLTCPDSGCLYQDFVNRISQLKTARGIILDMRGYPNPRTQIAEKVMMHFSKDSIQWGDFRCPHYNFPNHEKVYFDAKKENEYLQPAADYIDVPVCILINHKAMSYSETLIEIMKRNHIGLLVGMPTIGTNGDLTTIHQSTFPFIMTGLKDFSGYHGKGIPPDIYVSPTLEDIRNGYDKILEVAKAQLLK